MTVEFYNQTAGMKVLLVSGPLFEQVRGDVGDDVIDDVVLCVGIIQGEMPLKILNCLVDKESDWKLLVDEADDDSTIETWITADIIARIYRAEKFGKSILIDGRLVNSDDVEDALVEYILSHDSCLPEVLQETPQLLNLGDDRSDYDSPDPSTFAM